MKNLIFVLVILCPSLSFSYATPGLLAPRVQPRNTMFQLEGRVSPQSVLAPVGSKDCLTCNNDYYMGTIKGASDAQLKNIKYHMAEIYGSGGSGGAKSGSVREN